MFKLVTRLTFFGLSTLFTAGCWVLGVRSGAPAPYIAPPPTPTIPQIFLEHSGARTSSVENFFNWQDQNSALTGSGGTAPGQPGLRLSLPAGSTVHITINQSSLPAALWVLELDSAGEPMHATSLTPTAALTPYTLLAPPGLLKLQVTAEWTYLKQVTHIFELDVK